MTAAVRLPKRAPLDRDKKSPTYSQATELFVTAISNTHKPAHAPKSAWFVGV